MRCLIAAAFLMPALLSQPAFAAAEKSSRESTPTIQQEEAEARARPAVDIKLRIRSRWADLSVRINFG
jgi:hypothetical protein